MRHATLYNETLYHAVWMHTVQLQARNEGWLAAQGQIEINEAVADFRHAESLGARIPSMAEACDYMMGG